MPMRPGEVEERARIETEARKLAHSGEHEGWYSIRSALSSQRRFTQLNRVFNNPWTCSELDRLCLEAKLRRKELAK